MSRWSLQATPPSTFSNNWFDPIKSGVRERVREFIEALIGELDAALARGNEMLDIGISIPD